MRGFSLAAAAFLAASPALGVDWSSVGDLRESLESNAFETSYRAFQWRAYREVVPFLAREDWEALPRRGENEPQQPLIVTLHHTEAHRTYEAEDGKATVRAIQRYHMDGRKKAGLSPYDDIGYHFLIDGAGRIYAGRPVTALGAHSRGYNHSNIGIALLGNFDKETPDQSQLDSLHRILVYLAALYRVGDDEHFIQRHRDHVGDTTCPGAHFAAMTAAVQTRMEADLDLRRPALARR